MKGPSKRVQAALAAMDLADMKDDKAFFYKYKLQSDNTFMEYVANSKCHDNVEDDLIDALDSHHHGTLSAQTVNDRRIRRNMNRATDALQGLTPAQREYFCLYVKHGGYQSLADATGVCLSTAWKRIDAIRKCMSLSAGIK